MRVGWIAAVAAMGLAAPAGAEIINYSETEPNNSIAQAESVPIFPGNAVRIQAFLEGAGTDYVDFFRFTVAPYMCPDGGPCIDFTVSTGYFDETAPEIGLFLNGVAYPTPTGVSTVGVVGAAYGTWTAGIRRGPRTTSSDYYVTFQMFQNNPVPEPATWVMMIAGVGSIGVMARRRRIMDRSASPQPI